MKLLTLRVLALLTLFTTVNVNADTYAIGDVGPAGGVVFHLSEDKLHGMESSMYLRDDWDDFVWTSWGCVGEYLFSLVGTDIGDGLNNTKVLVNTCPPVRGKILAAVWADKHVQNGYTNWYLPSLAELMESKRIKREFGWIEPSDGRTSCTWTSTDHYLYSADGDHAMAVFEDNYGGYKLYSKVTRRVQNCSVVAVRNF